MRSGLTARRESVFAESPNRIYMLFRGELPKMAPPKARLLPEVGPSISFPVAGLWRDTTTASPPGTGGTDNNMSEWLTAWEGKAPDLGIKGPPYRKMGVDAKWENCLVVVDGDGNIVETWKQWDKLFRRPHSVYISPYDPDKNVWIVDDNMQVIYRFTHDGKQLLQTIGTPENEGADATHFNRPTYLDWLPDGTFFVSDGYTGTRVAKFDKNGKFLMDWGNEGRTARRRRQRPRGNASRLLQQRARDRHRSEDAPRLRERPKQSPHPSVRRKRQVPLRMESRRQSIEPAPALHRIGQHHLDLRPHHQQDGRVGPARTPAVRLGGDGEFPGSACGASMG